MLIRPTRKRVALCYSSAQHHADKNLTRLVAEKTGDVVAIFTATAPSKQRPGRPSPGSLIDLMAAANRNEFDVVVADFRLVCTSPWDIPQVVGRLEDLGIEAVDIALGRMHRLEWLIRSAMSEELSRHHGRRVRRGIAAAKARRTAAVGHDAGQTSSDGV
ncbi:hypothetical protein [Brevundimonas sp. A19_0]|uniref:hypothetical protein n=1 Tax=Brevundimonas sp. A19_0 TaxID=2821087 RepID=UPI001ADB0285|nr:hypothetical protein [Brevundimonas sp. A19_0]MBO9502191.1 hypothetical protein [Brevundimonas sp. A19_0]